MNGLWNTHQGCCTSPVLQLLAVSPTLSTRQSHATYTREPYPGRSPLRHPDLAADIGSGRSTDSGRSGGYSRLVPGALFRQRGLAPGRRVLAAAAATDRGKSGAVTPPGPLGGEQRRRPYQCAVRVASGGNPSM